MTIHLEKTVNTSNENFEQDSFTSQLDFEKLVQTLKKSIPWAILIVILGCVSSYLYLRYTPPVFESISRIKLGIKSETSILGVSNPFVGENFGAELSGEIEILQSELFLGQVADVINYDVAYYLRGNILVEERYESCPFKIQLIGDKEVRDQLLDIKFLPEGQFNLSPYGSDALGDPFNLGDTIEYRGQQMVVNLTNGDFSGLEKLNFYFKINSRRSIVSYLKSNVRVNVENIKARTLRISLKDRNKFKARDFITAIDTLYLDYAKQTKNQAIEQQLAFLENQLKKTEKNIDQYESYFENFIIENRTLDLGEDLGQTISLLNELDTQSYDLKNHILTIKMILNRVQSSDELGLLPLSVSSQLPVTIVEMINSFEKEISHRRKILKSYKPNTLAALSNKRNLDNSRDNLIFLLTEYLLDQERSLQLIDNKRSVLEDQILTLPGMQNNHNRNRRFYDLEVNFYFSLIARKSEMEISKAGTVTNFVILSPANLPSSSVMPNKLMIYVVGVVGGVLLSLIFVGVSYLLNNEIITQKELENLSSVPVLGSIPFYRKEKLPLTKLVVSNNPKSSISEALRSVRTNMEFMNNMSHKSTVSVTSTISGEGKTFVAVNLGAIVAMSHKKVVVVDLDMRKPKVHVAFNAENDYAGTSTILIGKNTIDECVQKSEIHNLDYIPAGTKPPNPAELILSSQFEDFLEELKERYDIIFLDTPPVGLVTDGILAMKKSDFSIYVFKANYSKRNFVKSLHQLRKINKFEKISLVFNGVGRSNTYGYGSSYGYGGYGYGYYEDK